MKLLGARKSLSRLEAFASSGGIGPPRLLFLRSSDWSMGRLPSSGGIEPVRLLFWRSRRVTQPLLAVVTPNQVRMVSG